jgi:hypothetical protein
VRVVRWPRFAGAAAFLGGTAGTARCGIREQDYGQAGALISRQRRRGGDQFADPGSSDGLAELAAGSLDVRVGGITVRDKASEFGFA